MSAAQIAVILHLDVDPVNRWNVGEDAIANHIGDLVVQLLRGSGVVLADVEWLDEAAAVRADGHTRAVTVSAAQIARLANFIMAEVPGEPSQSEGAVDVAIRWMRSRLEAEAE